MAMPDLCEPSRRGAPHGTVVGTAHPPGGGTPRGRSPWSDSSCGDSAGSRCAPPLWWQSWRSLAGPGARLASTSQGRRS
eukprot:1232976-Alexandrium_andersonii.AAC.1